MNERPVNIFLWRYSLQSGTDAAAVDYLSAEEQDRASRFKRSGDRGRWITARKWLRVTLGEYLDLDPRQLRFTYGPNGKPMLGTPGSDGPSFNLSHTGETAIVAICPETEIGVDLEIIRPLDDLWEIADISFTPREIGHLRATAEADLGQTFFAYWTSKEAIIKARGLRMADMARIDLFGPGVVDSGQGRRSTAGVAWHVRRLDLPHPVVGAVAVTGEYASIQTSWMHDA